MSQSSILCDDSGSMISRSASQCAEHSQTCRPRSRLPCFSYSVYWMVFVRPETKKKKNLPQHEDCRSRGQLASSTWKAHTVTFNSRGHPSQPLQPMANMKLTTLSAGVVSNLTLFICQMHWTLITPHPQRRFKTGVEHTFVVHFVVMRKGLPVYKIFLFAQMTATVCHIQWNNVISWNSISQSIMEQEFCWTWIHQ